MISSKHRNKLIDGIVVAMSAPKGMRPKYGADAEDKKETPDEPEGDEGDSPAEESEEGTQYASDAFRAMDDKDPAAFREAIWGLMRSYENQ
jgi:hypothetical protein